MKIKGNISILINQEHTTIEIHDADASIKFLSIQLSPEQLSSALSRLSQVPCVIDLRGLDKIGKKITLNEIRNAVKALKIAKIKVYNYFVIGLPWEDENTAQATIDFAIELDADYTSFYTATPLPGTRYYNYVKKEFFEEIESFENAYYQPIIKSHDLSKERIFEIHKSAMRKFYLRPEYIFKMLLNIRSFNEFKNYFIAGINLLLRK